MSTRITVRELIDRLGEGPTVIIREIPWQVAGVKQQADHSDGTMRTRLNLTRLDPYDGTMRKMMMEVDLSDTVEIADSPAE